MKKIFLWCLALTAVSCGLEEVSERPQYGGGDAVSRPGMSSGLKDPPKSVTYVTAVEYPEGYDWRADVEKGTVKCSLAVYEDGVRVMGLPVGDEYEVSSDPDMHRMVNGYLYTDYSTDSETVIKKDGVEVIRYQGREMICGLVEDGGDVYTLGHPRSGDGFAYRRNGEVIVERKTGSSFGCLYQDAGGVSFAFREPVEAAGQELERYYCVLDGKVSQTAVREDVKKVWDVVIHNGEVCYLASVVGISSPVLFRSGGMKAMSMPALSSMLTCRIVIEDGDLCVEGLFRRDGKPLTSGIWREDGQVHLFADGMTVSSICMGDDGVCCILNADSPSERGVIYRNGRTFPMPVGYASVGGSPAVFISDSLHVGLSSLSGAPPLIWKDGQTTPLEINGFISTISTNRKDSLTL